MKRHDDRYPKSLSERIPEWLLVLSIMLLFWPFFYVFWGGLYWVFGLLG